MVYKRKYTTRSYARKSYYPSRRTYKPRNTISIPYRRKSSYRKEGIKACASLIKKKLKYTLSNTLPGNVTVPMRQYIVPNKGKVALVLGDTANPAAGGIWEATNIEGMAKHVLKKGFKNFSVYDKDGNNATVYALIKAWGSAQPPETIEMLNQVYINEQRKKQQKMADV